MPRPSLALPDPLRTGAYRLEIISACAKRVWQRETSLGLSYVHFPLLYITSNLDVMCKNSVDAMMAHNCNNLKFIQDP